MRVAALALVAAVVSLGARSAQAQRRQMDLKHLPSDAIAAVIAFPEELKSRKEFELMPFEVIEAAGKQETGLNFLELKQVVFFVSEPKTLQNPPDWGGLMHFSANQQLSDRLLADKQRAMHQGVEYYAPDFRFGTAICMRGSTLMMGSVGAVKKMIESNGEKGPAHRLLEAADPADVTAVASFTEIRPLVEQMIAQAPQLPPPFEPFKQIPGYLKSIEIRVDAQLASKTTIKVACKDERSAGRLEELVKIGLAFGKQAMMAQVTQEFGRQEDPVAKATLSYMTRLVNTLEKRMHPKRDGDTLHFETPVDYAATGVLVALLLPAVQSARSAARRMQSANNLKQIALAFHNYHDAFNKFPPQASKNKDGKKLLSWRVHILPYIEHSNLYDQFHLDEPWDSDHNKKLISKMPEVYRIPSRAERDHKTVYQVLTGGGLFGLADKNPRLGFRHVLDGTSNTIMVVEANPDKAVIWTKPEDLKVDLKDPKKGLGKARRGGFQAAMADGSVRFISAAVDAMVLKAMITPQGAEAVRLP